MKRMTFSKLWKLALVLALALAAQLAPTDAKAWPKCPGGACQYVQDPVTGCCSSPLECFDFCP